MIVAIPTMAAWTEGRRGSAWFGAEKVGQLASERDIEAVLRSPFHLVVPNRESLYNSMVRKPFLDAFQTRSAELTEIVRERLTMEDTSPEAEGKVSRM